jgi:hypothetical protein
MTERSQKMDDEDFDLESIQLTDAQKLSQFEITIKEIALLVVANIKTGNPELVIEEENLQQKFVIYVDGKKQIEFNIEGYQFFFKPERRKEIGLWSSFLEGSPESIAERVFLEEIRKQGYATKIPKRRR